MWCVVESEGCCEGCGVYVVECGVLWRVWCVMKCVVCTLWSVGVVVSVMCCGEWCDVESGVVWIE